MSASVVTTRPVTFRDLSPEDEPGTEYVLPAGSVVTTSGDVQPDGRQYVLLPWGSAQGALLPGDWMEPCSACGATGLCAPECSGWSAMLDRDDSPDPAPSWARMAVTAGRPAFDAALIAAAKIQGSERTTSVDTLWSRIERVAAA